MPPIKLHDKSFDTYLSEQSIQSKIAELAKSINKDYQTRTPYLLQYLMARSCLLQICLSIFLLMQKSVL